MRLQRWAFSTDGANQRVHITHKLTKQQLSLKQLYTQEPANWRTPSKARSRENQDKWIF